MGTLQLIIEIIILFLGLYLAFFKGYFKQKGKNLATLKDIGEITNKVEEAKKEYNEKIEEYKAQLQQEISKEIEPFKAALDRENISFEIFQREAISIRFKRIDKLYFKLYELQKYIMNNLFLYSSEADFREKKKGFYTQYSDAEKALYKASLYIDSTVFVAAIDHLQECENSLQAFSMYYNSDPEKNKFIFTTGRQDLIDALIKRNDTSLERLEQSRSKLTEFLLVVENEFKKHLKSKF